MSFKWSSFLKNQRGQSAIFVALMFNVLFVFFAMSINVAMVVHDKINLQNSVDLGAYYAAQKQAEILNAMAHQNYAIRQSWKLLSWRYRVLGTMGLEEPKHPTKEPVNAINLRDIPYELAKTPLLCMTYHPNWFEVPKGENLCKEKETNIPGLPEVKVIAGFLGVNHGIAALARQLKIQFSLQCDNNGAFNWWFASTILHAFRLDQRNRKQVIYGLATGLASKKDDFIDLDGNSVLEGVRQTILKNLTYANREKGVDVQIFNSLGSIPYQSWLSEVQIAPTALYMDIQDRDDGCFGAPSPIQNLPRRDSAKKWLVNPPPLGLGAADLIPWKDQSVLRDSDFQYSIGVEKNPWVMPYVGVKVETNPRQVFFPVAGALKMVARAFAKPFGGRIGPWYSEKWDKGAPESSGSEVDALLPPRVSPTGISSSTDTRRLPNYSRFPGDQLGLISRLAQNSMVGLLNIVSKFEYYKNTKADIAVGAANDVLAWDGVQNKAPDIREYEIAAIAPDLFDVTYYSIDPNFTKNYWERLSNNRSRLGIPFDVPVRPDLGHNSNIIPSFNVQEQMATAKTRQRRESFYFIRDKSHLLTSWLPGPGTYNYDNINAVVPFFGQCAVTDDTFSVKNPGSCVAGGGRTGYSVKIVSRDFLQSNQIRAGGPKASPNAILNPPPTGW